GVTAGAARAEPDASPGPSRQRRSYEPPFGLLEWFNPLAIRVVPELADTPALNVLLPALGMKHMTGGPNTAINLACRLATRGVAVRLVSTDLPPDADPTNFRHHIMQLARPEAVSAQIEVANASDRGQPLAIGANDIFMATAWWTAQMAKYAVRHTRHRRFVYLIQDYEPLFHPAGTNHALAEETYRLDHIPVINTSLLHEFLTSRGVGRFAAPGFAETALVFEPSVDASRFSPPDHPPPGAGRRRLLFYARPKNGVRNAFELGVAALQKLICEGAIEPADWEFVGMGEQFAPVALGSGAVLAPAPWLDLDGYATLLKESDVLLSPMLSPHPSYPPLEMAACGRPVVTTAYANKTAERLAEISPNIIGVEPTIEGIAAGVLDAIRRPREAISGGVALPSSWSASFKPVLPRLHAALLTLFDAPALPPEARLAEPRDGRSLFPGYRAWPCDRYNLLRHHLLSERKRQYRDCEAGLFSLLTT
ncbi:MAG: hypothetical protein ACREFZ_09705, partial [Acetobacteraceae bacterium]